MIQLEILLKPEQAKEIMFYKTQTWDNSIKIARTDVGRDELQINLYQMSNIKNPLSPFTVGKSFYFSIGFELQHQNIIGKDMGYTLDEAYSQAIASGQKFIKSI